MATAVSESVRHVILAETGIDDCRIVSLLAGCFGNHAWMQESYGVTIDRCRLVMEGVEEMPQFVKDETGQDMTVKEILAVMREANDSIEELWDERMAGY